MAFESQLRFPSKVICLSKAFSPSWTKLVLLGQGSLSFLNKGFFQKGVL